MVKKIKFNADWVRKEMQDKGITFRYFCKETGLCSHSTLCKYLKESAVPEERWNDFEEALRKFGLYELDGEGAVGGRHAIACENDGIGGITFKNCRTGKKYSEKNEDVESLPEKTGQIFTDLKNAINDVFGLSNNYKQEEEMIVEKIYPKRFTKKCSDIREFWGDYMPMLAMEEASEFTQAISKMERWHCMEGKDYDELVEAEENLIEEMADILISIECIRQLYGIDVKEVKKAIKKKQKKRY